MLNKPLFKTNKKSRPNGSMVFKLQAVVIFLDRREVCFSHYSKIWIHWTPTLPLGDLEHDLYRSKWPCCYLKTCFPDVSSHFEKKTFLKFVTLNDLCRSRWLCCRMKHVFSTFHLILEKKKFWPLWPWMTYLERSRVKHFIALHIYTIASSNAIRMNSLQ